MRVWTKHVDEYFCPALTVLGAHNATAFAAKVDEAEAARRLEAMPNADVRRKWQRVFDRGYGDEDLADACGKLARVAAKRGDPGDRWLARTDGFAARGRRALKVSARASAQSRLRSFREAGPPISVSFVQQRGINHANSLARRNFAA